MKKPPAEQSASRKLEPVKRGRRSQRDKAGIAHRITVSPVAVVKSKGGKRYEYTSWLVQGWKEAGKWQRKRFKDRLQAEEFAAERRRGPLVELRRNPVLTALSEQQVREAEMACAELARLAGALGEDPGAARFSLLQAVRDYAQRIEGTETVERVSIRDAIIECARDKSERMRERSCRQMEGTLRAFSEWFRARPRFLSDNYVEDWFPPVCEVTAADVAEYLGTLRGRDGGTAGAKTWNNVRADLRAFFGWCAGRQDDAPMPGVTRRWCRSNPAADVPKKSVAAAVPEILSPAEARQLMAEVEAFRGGCMVPFFALALFAGIRPGPDGELRKLARHPGLASPCREAAGRPLVDLERGIITIPAEVAKTGRRRVITIQPNLRQWLARSGLEIWPRNADRFHKALRAAGKLGHDVLRHSFISYLIGLTHSKGKAALEAGNSESVIDAHYLNLPVHGEAVEFWAIGPQGESVPSAAGGLRVVA